MAWNPLSLLGSLANWFTKPTVNVTEDFGMQFGRELSPWKLIAVTASAAAAAFGAKNIADKLTSKEQGEILSSVAPTFQTAIGSVEAPFRAFNLGPLANQLAEESNFVGSKFYDVQLEFDKAIGALRENRLDEGIGLIEAAQRKIDEFATIHIPSAREDEDLPADVLNELANSVVPQIKNALSFDYTSIRQYQTTSQQLAESIAKTSAEQYVTAFIGGQLPAPTQPPVSGAEIEPLLGVEQLEELRLKSFQSHLQSKGITGLTPEGAERLYSGLSKDTVATDPLLRASEIPADDEERFNKLFPEKDPRRFPWEVFAGAGLGGVLAKLLNKRAASPEASGLELLLSAAPEAMEARAKLPRIPVFGLEPEIGPEGAGRQYANLPVTLRELEEAQHKSLFTLLQSVL